MINLNEAEAGRFTLTVAGLPPEALTVVEFAGTEEISRPYSFSILVVSDRDDLEIMDRGATFTIRGLADRGRPATVSVKRPASASSIPIITYASRILGFFPP